MHQMVYSLARFRLSLNGSDCKSAKIIQLFESEVLIDSNGSATVRCQISILDGRNNLSFITGNLRDGWNYTKHLRQLYWEQSEQM